MKRFWDGLIFGAGFSIAFMVVTYLGSVFLLPLTMNYASDQARESFVTAESEKSVEFHELSFEDKLKNASAVLVTRHEETNSGKTIAIIEQIYLGSPDVKVYFKVGDEYPDGSFFPEENTRYGEGAVVLLVNSPADVRYSTSIYSGRISAHGNMPVETAISVFNSRNTEQEMEM